MNRNISRTQWERDPSGTNGELESGAATCQLGQDVDDGIKD